MARYNLTLSEEQAAKLENLAKAKSIPELEVLRHAIASYTPFNKELSMTWKDFTLARTKGVVGFYYTLSSNEEKKYQLFSTPMPGTDLTILDQCECSPKVFQFLAEDDKEFKKYQDNQINPDYQRFDSLSKIVLIVKLKNGDVLATSFNEQKHPYNKNACFQAFMNAKETCIMTENEANFFLENFHK